MGINEISLGLKEYDSYHRLLHWNPMGFQIHFILNSSKCVAERSIKQAGLIPELN